MERFSTSNRQMTTRKLYGLKRVNIANFPHLHSRSASNLSYLMAKECGLSDREAADVRLGAYLHDLGKIAISPKIINKPGPLNKNEWQDIFMHPSIPLYILIQLFRFVFGHFVRLIDSYFYPSH